MNAQDVADYLQQHPEFFDEHAALFSTLTVPHPHGGRAIPLAERQTITLREKNRGLELKVAELLRFGQENDAIAERLARWMRMLLLQRSVRLLPETLTGSLEEIFSVPQVALSLWEASDEFAEVLEDGKAYTVQYYERVRLEYHPENAEPYTVLLGQFGRRIHPADPPVLPVLGAVYFGETGHNITRAEFAAYYDANGDLAQFGYPLRTPTR